MSPFRSSGRCLRYRGDLKQDFVEPLVHARVVPPRLCVVGPIPVFVVMRPSLLRHTGWRALLMDGHVPFAAVDVGPGQGRGSKRHVLHSAEMAATMLEALRALRRHGVQAADFRVLQTWRWRDGCVGGAGAHPLVVPIGVHRWRRQTRRRQGHSHVSFVVWHRHAHRA